ncbi:hypothetical protein AF72_05935 [Xylella taiwanensis]|uniref:Uncharacterized protein n=1 Tax=Xylella taiwanensis TaxID=1444770 RepID=Z9JJG1_9GAMM|nr:hypothetical protein AF72_05935 [Xylella taiwanensis]
MFFRMTNGDEELLHVSWSSKNCLEVTVREHRLFFGEFVSFIMFGVISKTALVIQRLLCARAVWPFDIVCSKLGGGKLIIQTQ